jgi:pimeloyl-ACP methyl ester carboxylesterase
MMLFRPAILTVIKHDILHLSISLLLNVLCTQEIFRPAKRMASLPSIIFVHGAWHSGECFHKVVKLMEDSGYNCRCVELPSAGPKAGSRWLEDDTVVIREAIKAELDVEKDVVMVLHSYGGIPGNNALQGLDARSRSQARMKGSVIKIVMLAAFIIPKGPPGELRTGPPVSIFDIKVSINSRYLTQNHVSSFQGDTCTPRDPIGMFYHDLEPTEAQYWTDRIRPSSYPNHRYPAYAGWEDIPTTYLICEKDQAIQPGYQERMISAAQSVGGKIEVVRCPLAHSPFLSNPRFVAELIRKNAGEIS